MPSPQTDTYILLGSTTGLLSFLVSLLLSQSLTTALKTGAIAVPASLCGGAIANRRRVVNARRYRGSLDRRILELEKEEAEVYGALQATLQTYQDLQAQVNSLSIEYNQFQNGLGHLQNQLAKLQYNLEYTRKQAQHQEIQYQQLQARVLKLRKQEEQLQTAIDTKNSFIRFKELRVNHLQEEIRELITQKRSLQAEIEDFKHQQQTLEEEADDLQMHINILQQQQDQIQSELLSLQIRKTELDNQLATKLEHIQQNTQEINAQEAEQQQLEQQLRQLQQQKQQLESQVDHLIRPKNQPDRDASSQLEASNPSDPTTQKNFWENWQEWLDFTQQLSHGETSALKAILAGDEAQLKEIADLKFLMPQVLIEGINQKALMCLGDTILTVQGSSVLPAIHPEYYQALVRAMAKVT